MPQHQLFTSQARLTGLRIEVVDRLQDLVDGFDLTVATRHDRDDWRTLHSARYDDVMTDLIPSAVQDVVSAWLWEEGMKAVARAAQSNHRVATAHKRRFHG